MAKPAEVRPHGIRNIDHAKKIDPGCECGGRGVFRVVPFHIKLVHVDHETAAKPGISAYLFHKGIEETKVRKGVQGVIPYVRFPADCAKIKSHFKKRVFKGRYGPMHRADKPGPG